LKGELNHENQDCSIYTVDDAPRLAKASGCDNVGLIFNLCHFLKVAPGSDLQKTLDAAKPFLWAVSTSGTDWLEVAPGRHAAYFRLRPAD